MKSLHRVLIKYKSPEGSVQRSILSALQKAIGDATKVLQETTSGAEGQTYSFLQMSLGMRTGVDLAKGEVVMYASLYVYMYVHVPFNRGLEI